MSQVRGGCQLSDGLWRVNLKPRGHWEVLGGMRAMHYRGLEALVNRVIKVRVL
jgi:hypothetical protein